VVAIAVAAVGALLFVVAAVFRLFAWSALVLRDLVRNSFVIRWAVLSRGG
jgi:hypothetical protein